MSISTLSREGGQLHLQKSAHPSRPRPAFLESPACLPSPSFTALRLPVFSIKLRAWAAVTTSTPSQAAAEVCTLMSPDRIPRGAYEALCRTGSTFFLNHRLTVLVKNEQGHFIFSFNKGALPMTTAPVLTCIPLPQVSPFPGRDVGWMCCFCGAISQSLYNSPSRSWLVYHPRVLFV